LTPLEVMLKTMRALVRKAQRAPKLRTKEDGKGASALDLMVQAAAVAKDAAPYMHPRLSAIEHTGREGGPIVGINITAADPVQAAREYQRIMAGGN